MSEADISTSSTEPDNIELDGQPEGAQAYQPPDLGETDGADATLTSGPSDISAQDEAIYTIRLLTALTVGGVVEGSSQLVARLKRYEQELQQAGGDDVALAINEDEFDRLRYAAIGLLFDTQNMIGRSLVLSAQLAETTLDVTKSVTRPFRNFFLFRPVTKRVEQRFDRMTDRGQDNLARWISLGRQIEPEGRALATMTYGELVDEFISTLSKNPELKALVAQQSASLAAGMRDEVRERTVTSDNVIEDIARKILRRPLRPDLAQPPPQVRRWAGISPDELRQLEQSSADEQLNDSAE